RRRRLAWTHTSSLSVYYGTAPLTNYTLSLHDALPISLLAEHQIQLVVDVRRYPASRRYPHFAQEPLAAALGAAGIDYRHDADLGGRRSARNDSPNTGWRSAGFRGYADHMETPAFEHALVRLTTAGPQPPGILWPDAVPWP